MDLRRDALLARIGRESSAQLVLIQAPAGYGKSTLLRQLAEEEEAAGSAVGWISPTSQDADLARLVQLFSASCERILTDAGRRPPISRDLPSLLRALDFPTLFIFDEYDHFARAETDAYLAQLIAHLPPGVRIALAARSMPQLAASRLKLDGRAVILGSVDLRFDLGEAHQFLAAKPALSADEIRRLYMRLDGWPAGFQFISLALRSPGLSFGDALTHALSRDLVDYLAQEVFDQQSDAMRELLMLACLPDRISAALLDHINGKGCPPHLLEGLWSAGLFLDPVDGDRVWFRFHPLFGDFLHAQLRKQVGEAELRERHRRIAEWQSANGMDEAAVGHFLAAGARDAAADLVEHLSERLVREERLGLLVSMVEQLDEGVFLARQKLVANAVIAYGFRRDFARAHRLLDGVEQREPDADRQAQAEHQVQRCFVLAAEDRVEELGMHGRDAARWLDDDNPFFLAVALNAHAFLLAAQSQFTEAEELMLRALPLHEQASSYFGGSYASAILAVSKVSQGQVEEGAQFLARALERIAGEAAPGIWAGAAIAAHYGDALYERNRLAEAKAVVESHFAFIQQQCIPDALCLGTVALARCAAIDGDVARTHELYEELIAIGHRFGLARLVACGRAELVREATLAGDFDTAERRMRALGADARMATDGQLIYPGSEMEAQRITWLRLLVHSGRHGEARAALQAEIRGATVKHRVRRLVRLKLLLAICLDIEGNQMLARRTLIEALGLAAPGGMIRTIVDEGPAAMRLVGDLRAEGLASGVKWGNDPVAALVEALIAAESGGAGSAEETPVEAPLEPLTQRERDLLHFLALGYSNAGLSDRLAVSENTVKFHLRNIYAKLGVGSRMQAVQAARHYRLVD